MRKDKSINPILPNLLLDVAFHYSNGYPNQGIICHLFLLMFIIIYLSSSHSFIICILSILVPFIMYLYVIHVSHNAGISVLLKAYIHLHIFLVSKHVAKYLVYKGLLCKSNKTKQMKGLLKSTSLELVGANCQ